jgi:hypothetical protein
MISVLICSSKPDLLAQVQSNIQNTIGVEYEILYFDNREINKGICGVYNELASKAQFHYLCFLHEDILFETKEWGNKIIEIFSNDPGVGLVGVAGCKYKSAYFSGWFSNVKELDCANYVHQYTTGTENVYLSPTDNNIPEEVVCIDGVFMCSTKEAWKMNQFNEDLLKGFHFYDIDFSLRIAHHFKVVVTYDVQLRHITTGGDYNDNWVQIAIKYHSSKKMELPYSKIDADYKLADRNVIKATLDFLKNYNISFRNKMKWVILQNLYLSPQYYYPILKFLFYKPFKLKHLHNLLRSK